MEGMTLEKLKVVIEAYTKPYKDEMDKIRQKTAAVTNQIERETSKMRTAFSKTARVVGTVLSITAIAAFGKSCIELGSNLSEVQNVVDVTFGDMNRKVDAFSKNAIKQYGLSELAAKEYMGTYGSMAKSFGFTTNEVYELSASITGLTGDLASFRNLTTDEAYTKLKSIFTGETESLKEIGVVMTQTALDQYALNEGLGKTTANMTEQEKVMLRYRFVMSSLSDASGDFARTSHSWANQVRVLQLQFESLKATIGQGLINAFTPAIYVINTILERLQTLAAYFRAFTAALFGDASNGNVAEVLGSAAGSSGAVANNMGSAAKAAKDMKKSLASFDELNNLSSNSSNGGAGGGSAAFGNLNGTLFGETTVNPEIEEATDRIRIAVDQLREAAGPAREALRRLWGDGLTKLGTFSWTGLQDFWEYFLKPLGGWALGEGFPRFVDITNDFLTETNWNDINDALREFWQALEPFAENVGEGLLDFYEGLAEFGSEFINAIVPGGIRALADALNSVDAENARSFGYALGALSTILPGLKIAGIIAPQIESLVTVLKNLSGFAIALGGPGTAAFDVMGMQIVDAISNFIEENFGQSVVDAIGHGLLTSVGVIYGGALAGPIGALAGGIVVTLADVLMNIDWSGDVWEKVCKKIFNFDTANALAEQANEFFETAFNTENVLEFGMNIVAGIGAGITSGIAYLIEPITDLFDFVIKEICDLFGIHSPASAMEPYGQYILEGIILGFRSTFGNWTNSLDEWYSQHIEPWFTLKKWSDLYESIKVSMKTKWDETAEQWETDVNAWWSENVEPWFTKEKWKSVMSEIPSAFGSIFKDAVNAGVEQLNKLIDWVNEKLNFSFDGYEILGEEVIPAFNIQLFRIPHIPTFASGGFPTTGQLFIANESGPELVGRIGNRTSVANTEQIVDAVARGVFMAISGAGMGDEETMYRAFRRALEEVPLGTTRDPDRDFKMMQTKAAEYKKRTGKPAFGY